MIEQFDYNSKKRIRFCESCVGSKIHHNSFKPSRRHTTESLELVYLDVCGKMDEKSQGGTEYFLLLTTTSYAWVYSLRTKDQVFERFVQLKHSLREKSSEKKLKILRTDNGGEFTSTQFEDFLKTKEFDTSEPSQRCLNRMVSQRDLTELLSLKCHNQCYLMPNFLRSIGQSQSPGQYT